MCLQIRPSCAMRTWKSGQVQEPLPCGSSLTLYPVPLLLVTTNSGKSPSTCRRFVFISSTARAPAVARLRLKDGQRQGCRVVDSVFGSPKTLWIFLLWIGGRESLSVENQLSPHLG